MNIRDLLSIKKRDYFYIMHLSYDGRQRRRLWNYAREGNLIGLSHGDVNDDWNKVQKFVAVSDTWRRQFDTFCNRMVVDDIVLVLHGWFSLLGIAEVSKPRHRYDERLSMGVEPFFDHVREVRWIRRFEYDNRLALPEPLEGFNNTLSIVDPTKKYWPILINLDV